MAWTTLTFAFGSLLTSTKMTQLYDNLTALANGDSGAPNIVAAAITAGAVTPDKLTAPAAGEYVVFKNEVERSTTSTSAVKLKEVKWGSTGGTLTVKFSISGVTSNGYAQIYKNGSAVGTSRSNAAGYVEYSENLTFAEGDLIQVYAYHTGGTVYIKDLKICLLTPYGAGGHNSY